MSFLGTLFGCNSSKETGQGSAVSGSLEIKWTVIQSRSGSWFNNGGDPNAKVYTSYFNINCQGQPVIIPSSGGPQKDFWQAWFLKDAPQPAVLAGIHSMYLITEEQGKAKITPLHEQDGDFATCQWLDSDDGQPGMMVHVTLGDDSHSSRDFSGGRYLMVNSRVILDVQTLEVYPFDLITYEVLQKLENYHAGNSFVAQFSPGKTQMVLIGNRDNPANRMLYQYALVVIDFKKNTAYAVPFDRTETRFFSIWDADQQWMNTYFDWSTDEEGNEVIKLHAFDQLPYWQGRWTYSEETGQASEYKLQPVDTAMLPVFLDFIRKEVKINSEKRDEVDTYASSGDQVIGQLVTVQLSTDDGVLQVYLNPVEQSISLTADQADMIVRLGKKFDSEMSNGKYQEYFSRYE